jgi:hypothetical protein
VRRGEMRSGEYRRREVRERRDGVVGYRGEEDVIR